MSRHESGDKKRSLRITRHTGDTDQDVRDEVQFHIDMRARELEAEGLDAAEARQRAEAAFGDRPLIEREAREITAPEVARRRRTEWFGAILRDLRFAARGLGKNPGFALVAVLTLALCIGANVAVFTVVNGVVLQPLPFPEADRLVTFYNAYPGSGIERTQNSVPDFYDRGEGIPAVESVALYDQISVTIGAGETSRNVFVSRVTPSFFEVLGVRPALGTGFGDADAVVGQNTNIVISHGFWQGHLGGAQNVIGRTVDIEGTPYQVVGVMPADFEFVTWNAQVWFSLAFSERLRQAYHSNNFEMLGRLRPEATVAVAQQQLDALTANLLATYSERNRQALEAAGFQSRVRGWQDDLTRDFRGPLYLLWASVALVLAIGVFNVANLLLLRLSARVPELATRFMLGASRTRIAAQLLTESMLLTVLGGGIGLALGAWSLRYLGMFEHYQVPRLSEVAIDGQVLVFTLGASLFVAGLASVVPVGTLRRGALHEALRTGATGPARDGVRAGAWSARGLLVAAQVAAAFVLVTTGGLLLSSILSLWAVDPGFDIDDLAIGAVVTPPERYPEASDRLALRARALEALRAIPGVTGAAFASQLPFSGEEHRQVVFPEGHEYGADEAIEALFQTTVSAGYFDTLGVPLIAGRAFDRRDVLEGAPVTIVDEHFAQRYWPDNDAVGKRVALNVRPSDDESWVTVIGVVGSVVQNDLDEQSPIGAFYLPDTQSRRTVWRFALRTDGPLEGVHAMARATFRSLDAQMPTFWTGTMRGSVAERLIPRRIPMMLVIAFAAVALLLSTLGLHGVLAFTARRRTREFGVRVALGSTTGDIYRVMLLDAARVVGGGLVVGAGAALMLNRLVASQLYGVQPSDPRVMALAAALILTVALVASLLPTRRATRVDPISALRDG